MMPSPSAICTVNSQTISTAGTSGVNVSPSSTVSIRLASSAGLNLGLNGGGWSISCTGVDGKNVYSTTTAQINNTLSVLGYPNYVATFTAPDMDGYKGSAMQFTSTVNAGLANQDTTTFGIFVLNSNGTRFFFGPYESFESNATVGCAADLNEAMAIGFGSADNLLGDVVGLVIDNTVVAIQGETISSTPPQNNDVLTFDGTSWTPELVNNEVINVATNLGCIGDGVLVNDGHIINGSMTLTCATSHPFKSSDAGKLIVVQGAGAAGVPLATTISVFNSPSIVTLTAAASTTVVGAIVDYGTDNTAAINAFLSSGHNGLSQVMYFPPGTYLTTGGHQWTYSAGSGTHLRGSSTPAPQNTTCSIIKAAASCAYLFQGIGWQSHLSDLWFHGNGLAQDVMQLVYLSTDCVVERCFFTNPVLGLLVDGGGYCLHIPNGPPGAEEVNNIVFENCLFAGTTLNETDRCGAAVYMYANSESTLNEFRHCIMEMADYSVLNIGCDANFLQCQLYFATSACFFLDVTENNIIEGCYSEQIGAIPWLMMGNNSGENSTLPITLRNNIINDGYAYLVLNCTQPVVLESNVFGGNVQIVPIPTIGIYQITSIGSAFQVPGSGFTGEVQFVDQINTSSTEVPSVNLFNTMNCGENTNITITTTSAGATGQLIFNTAHEITVLSPTSNIAVSALTLQGGTPYASASSTSTKTAGSVIINTTAPVSGGNVGGLQIAQAGSLEMLLSAYPAGGAGAIYLGASYAASPSNSDYTLYGDDSGNVILNANADDLQFRTANVNRVQLSSAGLTITPSTINWSATTLAPTITQLTAPVFAVAASLTIEAQSAAASSTGVSGGDLVLTPGDGASGSAAGFVNITNAVTATSATTGAVTLGNAVGYFELKLNGTVIKVPYYSV